MHKRGCYHKNIFSVATCREQKYLPRISRFSRSSGVDYLKIHCEIGKIIPIRQPSNASILSAVLKDFRNKMQPPTAESGANGPRNRFSRIDLLLRDDKSRARATKFQMRSNGPTKHKKIHLKTVREQQLPEGAKGLHDDIRSRGENAWKSCRNVGEKIARLVR